MKRALALPLLALLACSPTSDPGKSEQAKSEQAKAREISVQTSPVEASVGDLLEWSIASSSLGIEDRYRTQWGAPFVSGDAVELIETREDRPAEVGGSDVTVYVFRAVAPGTATLSTSASSWPSADGKVPGPGDYDDPSRPKDLVIEITVAER